jgi:mannitol/fructose-specific phosphotransferase system IIA component (Ntr-type)
MALRDYVCREAICTDLQVEDRDEAIRVLLEKFVDGGALAAGELDEVFGALIKRELLGSTAIGNGVAVPHARMDGLSGIAVGFAQCPQGVEFNALDGAPVYEVFLVIASREHNDEYITVMERITRLVQNQDFRRFVAAARNGAQVLELIDEMDR